METNNGIKIKLFVDFFDYDGDSRRFMFKDLTLPKEIFESQIDLVLPVNGKDVCFDIKSYGFNPRESVYIAMARLDENNPDITNQPDEEDASDLAKISEELTESFQNDGQWVDLSHSPVD